MKNIIQQTSYKNQNKLHFNSNEVSKSKNCETVKELGKIFAPKFSAGYLNIWTNIWVN